MRGERFAYDNFIVVYDDAGTYVSRDQSRRELLWVESFRSLLLSYVRLANICITFQYYTGTLKFVSMRINKKKTHSRNLVELKYFIGRKTD